MYGMKSLYKMLRNLNEQVYDKNRMKNLYVNLIFSVPIVPITIIALDSLSLSLSSQARQLLMRSGIYIIVSRHSWYVTVCAYPIHKILRWQLHVNTVVDSM